MGPKSSSSDQKIFLKQDFGFKFKFNSMDIQSMEHKDFGFSAPEWRVASSGLNLNGMHPIDSQCKAKG